MIKNILAVLGILVCIAWGQKVYEKSEVKERFEKLSEHISTEELGVLIDEVYND